MLLTTVAVVVNGRSFHTTDSAQSSMKASQLLSTDEKLCDLILKAKMLLEGSQVQMDTLIQHFYYTAAHEN